MNYVVRGTDRQTGEAMRVVIDAFDEIAARDQATKDGLVVQSVKTETAEKAEADERRRAAERERARREAAEPRPPVVVPPPPPGAPYALGALGVLGSLMCVGGLLLGGASLVGAMGESDSFATNQGDLLAWWIAVAAFFAFSLVGVGISISGMLMDLIPTCRRIAAALEAQAGRDVG